MASSSRAISASVKWAGGRWPWAHTLLEKSVPKLFFGYPNRRTLFDFRYNPFGFHEERALHGTQKGSTRNQKQFFQYPHQHTTWKKQCAVLVMHSNLKCYASVDIGTWPMPVPQAYILLWFYSVQLNTDLYIPSGAITEPWRRSRESNRCTRQQVCHYNHHILIIIIMYTHISPLLCDPIGQKYSTKS